MLLIYEHNCPGFESGSLNKRYHDPISGLSVKEPIVMDLDLNPNSNFITIGKKNRFHACLIQS